VYFLCILRILYFVLWTIVILCAIDTRFIKCNLLITYLCTPGNVVPGVFVSLPSLEGDALLHVHAKLPFLCFSRVVAVSAASQ